MIPYSRQFVDEEDIRAVVEVLRSDYLTQGLRISDFENALAQYCKAQYSVVFSSGTAALHAAYFSAGISENDEIITSPITFVATANAACYLGGRPVFADVEFDTGNIQSDSIQELVTSKTKAIVPVHFGGHPVNLEDISKIAKMNSSIVIEDACHALGAKYKEHKIGSCNYSDMTVFSFHPVKQITTGEGGAVTTNRKDFYEKLLLFRTHGIVKNQESFVNVSQGDWYYEMQFLGFNYRLTDIQAALGLTQLKKLDSFVTRRRELSNTYSKLFKGMDFFEVPVEKEYAYSSYHLYPLRLKDKYKFKKKEIFLELRQKGIGVQVHYIPVYQQPYYLKNGYKTVSCSTAEDFYLRELSIPLYPSMRDADLIYVYNVLCEVFREL